MALTADIAWTKPGPSVRMAFCICTVTNGGGTAVNVLSVVPSCVITGTTNTATAAAVGRPVVGGNGASTSVPAGGTLAFAWEISFNAPTIGSTNGAEPGLISYTPRATIYASDGSITEASLSTGSCEVTDTTLEAGT